MSVQGPIRQGEDDLRQLVDQAVAEGRVTVCPPATRAAGRRSAPIERVTAEGPPTSRNPEPREVRQMSVRSALEWAFGTEHARLSFGSVTGTGLPSFGTEFLLMERGMLGQQVDVSPGRSRPADDAELIADAVQAALAPGQALRLAELARAGTMPWSNEAPPKLEPLDWVCGRGGKWRGRTADARELGAEGWRPMERVNRLGRRVREPVKFTPCRMTVSAQQIARKRREHLEWWGDLLSVRASLRAVTLRWIEITEAMPPMQPWNEWA